MSSISPRWRSSSRSRSAATSGSTSASPAVRRCSSVSGVVAIGRMLLPRAGARESLRRRHRAFAQDARLGPGHVEDRRRRARQLAARREPRRRRRGSPSGTSVDRRGIGAAVEVRARRRDAPTRARSSAAAPTSRGAARRSCRRAPAEPGQATCRIREDERDGPARHGCGRRARASARASGSTLAATMAIGCSGERRLSAESARTDSSRSGRQRARRRCPSGPRRAARVDRLSDLVDRSSRARPPRRRHRRSTSVIGPSTTRSRPARSRVVVTSCVAEVAEQRSSTRRRLPPRPPARGSARAEHVDARRAPLPRSRPRRRAPPAAPSREPRARAGRSPRAGRRAGSRRRDPTARPEVP